MVSCAWQGYLSDVAVWCPVRGRFSFLTWQSGVLFMAVKKSEKEKIKHENTRNTFAIIKNARGRTALPHMSATQHQSRIGECQILRAGPFFMVEYLANTILKLLVYKTYV